MHDPVEFNEHRATFIAPGKLNTFKHYYRIGGFGLVGAGNRRQALEGLHSPYERARWCPVSCISVIVPVYNVAHCLDACMESLQAQTLEDIEIICVNDGSTDGSCLVLEAWAARDARICVVDKQNGGLSSARNAGIHAARSPYVCFLDSDDRFHARACEEMVRST